MASPADLGAIVDQAFPILSAIAIAMARPAGAAAVLPVFTRAQLGGAAKGAIAIALGLTAVPGIARQIETTAVASPMIVLLATKEAFVGVLIGVLLGVPIWSVQAAGELLDTQRSATQDRQSEPDTGNEDSTTAAFLGMTVVALFVILGGLRVLAQTLDASYGVWPALRLLPLPTRGWADFLLGLLEHLTRVSLSLAAPVLLGMLLCEACVILLMRAVPKLRLYDLAPNLRNLMFALLMFAYANYLVVYMRGEIEQAAGAASSLRTLLR